MTRAAVTLAALGLLLAGCRGDEARGQSRTTIRPRDATLLPVALPAWEGFETAARVRIRERAEKLAARSGDRGASPSDLAAAYGELGKGCQAFGLYEPAAVCYENAARLEPGAFAWPYLLARVQQQLGLTDPALSSLRKALALEPDNLPALLLLADLQLTAGRLEEAREACRRALQVSPASARALYGLGHIAFLTGDLPEAVAQLEKALRLQPDANRLHYVLAMAYRRLGNEEQARVHLAQRGDGLPAPPSDPVMEAVAEIDPRTQARRGLRALRAGSHAQAVAMLQEASAAVPEDADLRLQLGVALASAGDPGAAQAQFEEAARLRPKDPRIHFQLGVALSALGRDGDAVVSLRRALELHPEEPQAQLALGQVLRRLGRDSEAARHLDEAVRLDPASIPARAARARMQARVGRCGEAVAGIAQAVQTFPQDGALADLMARLLAACPDPGVRDPSRALRMAEQSYKKEGTSERAATVAFVQAARGAWEEAARWQRKAIALLPEGGPPRMRWALGEQLRSYERRAMSVEW